MTFCVVSPTGLKFTYRRGSSVLSLLSELTCYPRDDLIIYLCASICFGYSDVGSSGYRIFCNLLEV